MVYGVLATLVLSLHLGYLGYLVFGGFLAWRWPVAFWPHLVAAVWGLAVVVFSIPCPLTSWENSLRTAAGTPEYSGSFIDHYIEGVVFPAEHMDSARWLVVVAVALSWSGIAVLWWRRTRILTPTPTPTSTPTRGRTSMDRSEATSGRASAKSGKFRTLCRG